MNNRFIFFQLILIVFFCSSCDRLRLKEGVSSSESRFLMEGVDVNEISRVEIVGTKRRVSITRTGKGWFLDAPYSVPAFPLLMDAFMLDCHQSLRGQSAVIDEADFERLSLSQVSSLGEHSEATPIELILEYGEPVKKLHFVLGAFDIPDDATNVQLYGERAMARRYIRNVSNNTVSLSPQSFSYISPDPNDWNWRKILPVNMMRELSVRSSSGFSWSAKKSGAYSSIQFDSPFENEEADRALVDFFAEFLADGLYSRVIEKGREAEVFNGEPELTLVTTDGHGAVHEIELGALLKENENTGNPAANLSEGVFKLSGQERTPEAGMYVARVNIIPGRKAGDVEKLVHPFRGRVLLLDADTVQPILDLTHHLEFESGRAGYHENK